MLAYAVLEHSVGTCAGVYALALLGLLALASARAEKPRKARAGVYTLAGFGLNAVLARRAQPRWCARAGGSAVLERNAGRA